MIKIDKGVPLPPHASRSVYPFETMAVDDSFAINIGSEDRNAVRDRLRSVATYWKKTHPDFHFEVRFVVEDDVDKVRLWRVKKP